MSIETAYQSMHYWQEWEGRDGLTLPFLCFVADVFPRELVESFKSNSKYMTRVNKCSTIGTYVSHVTLKKEVESSNIFGIPDGRGWSWRRDGSLFWHSVDFPITTEDWITEAEMLLSQGTPSRVRMGTEGDLRYAWCPMAKSEKTAWLGAVELYVNRPDDDVDEMDE